jgi:hypothetical protein
MLLMTLQFVPDSDDPYAIVHDLMDAVPSGSYLVISHPARDDGVGVANRATEQYNQRVVTPMTRRTFTQIGRFFSGLELQEPGLVPLKEWHPDPSDPLIGDVSPALCGMARKP